MLTLIFLAACALLVLAYFTYGAFVERRFGVDDTRPTPAHTLRDEVDYMPAADPILFGHHFSSIAGAGPIVGPILAGLAFGWGPALVWIVVGSIFVGGVHDFAALFASIRHRGQSIGQICRRYLSPVTYHCFLVFVWLAMIYVLAVFLDLTASSFAPVRAAESHGATDPLVLRKILEGGNVATSSLIYIGLAVLFGLSVYRWRIPLAKGSAIFVPLVFVALWVGSQIPLTMDRVPELLGSPKNTWTVVLIVYCFCASVLPVWVLLQPRDYLSSFLLYACLFGGAAGLVVAGLGGGVSLNYSGFLGFRDTFGNAPLGLIYPALFITIACGAVSGFHSIVASGTTAKQLGSERSARRIAYGGMLVEGALGLLALASVMILAGRPVIANPVAVFAEGIGTFVRSIGFPAELAVTFGMLAVSTFLLTTLDTCTRLGRFIFVELFGLKGSSSRYVGTLATLVLPSVLVFLEVRDATGAAVPAWKAIWPAFGTTNQLLAALALLIVYVWLRHEGRRAGFLVIPMVFMCVTTLTSLVQLIWLHLVRGENLQSTLMGGLCLLMTALAVTLIVDTARSFVPGSRRAGPGDAPPQGGTSPGE